MAKAQSFGDKLRKKKGDVRTIVKVIKWYKCEDRGVLRTLERFVPVKDVSEVGSIDINK